ncbi:MAG: GGDEF domain-containing protein [Spirochaetaceae bacterium]|jgi:diguanylate cyclase (GGDEF)-like protein|nr:GGDEF domain-containing protein [Spirochaetaceae bacterium]
MDDRAILEHVRKLLRDNKIPELEGELAEDPVVQQIHTELKEIREALYAFSAGDFSPVISVRGIIPGCLKALQSHLRHLIWQVQLIEGGDFSQEVRFMGEFSAAFNKMVRQLHSSLTALKQKEEVLTVLNEKLRGEIESHTSAVEALQESEARFKFLANHDPLTGILNRRSFIERAEFELKSAAALSMPSCLAMMDIDHFKQFNDTYGHLAGDNTLRHVVNVVSRGLRKNDFIGRYGGEEFVFAFPGIDYTTGLQVVERLRKSLAETPVSLENGPVFVYASFGVVGDAMEDSSGGTYIQKLINDADVALYAAKRGGRNRVILYTPELSVQFGDERHIIQEVPGEMI